MRNLYPLLLIFLFFTVPLTAQSSEEAETAFKHTITFGGSLRLSSERADDDNKSSSFLISPYVMRRVDRNWQVGLCLGFGRSVTHSRRTISNTPNSTVIPPFRGDNLSFGNGIFEIINPFIFSSTQDIETVYTQFTPCVFGRFTVNPDNALSVFVEPYFSYGAGKVEQKTFIQNRPNLSVSSTHTQNINLGSRLGLSYAINDHWRVTAFAGNLGYNYLAAKDDPADRFERVNSSAALDLSLRSVRLAVEFSL